MTTVYIDVYFLINFTVDILALYFGASFSKTPTSVKRLIIGALVGALQAIFGVLFMDVSFLMYPVSVISLLIITYIVAHGISFFRKVKFLVSFLLFEILIGGLVYYGYLFLDRFAGEGSDVGSHLENQNLLILSLLVLLSIGVIKIALLLFGNVRSEKSARLFISFSGREYVIDALIDSGNLAKDPLDGTPVMLLLSKDAKRVFGCDISESDGIDYKIKKRIRIIPVRFGENQAILFGIKPDAAYVDTKRSREKISIVIAVDKEGTGYGGFKALMPLSALENINF